MEYSSNGLGVGDEQSNSPNVKLIVYKILNNWYWYTLSFGLFFFLAFVYLKYTTPTYKITAKLLVNDAKNSGSTTEGDVLSSLGLFSTQNNVYNEIQILKSKTLLYTTIKDLQLNVTYYGEGYVKKTELYINNSPFLIKLLALSDSLKPDQTIEFKLKPVTDKQIEITAGDKTIKAAFGDTVSTEFVSFILLKTNLPFRRDVSYSMNIISYAHAYAELLPLFSIVATNEDVTTIDLSVTNPAPAKGEEMLNKLIDVYIKSNVSENNRIADSTISFIEGRLVFVQKELSDVEGQIETFKRMNKLADMNEQSRLLVNTNTELQKELSENEVQLQVIQMLENYLSDENNNKSIMPTTTPIQDPAFINTLEKYNTLQLQREGMLRANKENSPLIKTIDLQVAQLRSDLLKLLISFHKTLSLKQAQLSNENSKTNSYIKNVPALEKSYLEYSRQQDIKQQLYLYLLQKKEETAISKFNNVAPVRILDKATSDALPFSPNKMVILTTALLLGFFVPVGIIFGKEFFNNKILSQEDVSKITKVPVVAQISNSKHPEKILENSQSRNIVAEQFRILRSNLGFLMGAKGKVIMITSSMSKEGKSFISLNLSSVLAITGKRVLLLEFDLRRPRISQYLGLKNEYGFSNYVISEDMKLKDIIKPSGILDNWFILNSGSLPPNPAELLMNEKVSQLIQEAREQFDYIIMDTPPVGLVADAQTLAHFADVVLFIIRQKFTSKFQMQIIEDLRMNKKMSHLGIVLNDVQRGTRYGYGYGYRYGYRSKSYEGYYEETDNSKTFIERIRSSLHFSKQKK